MCDAFQFLMVRQIKITINVVKWLALSTFLYQNSRFYAVHLCKIKFYIYVYTIMNLFHFLFRPKHSAKFL